MSQNEKYWSDFLLDLETVTREGLRHLAIAKLDQIDIRLIPRTLRSSFSELARRNSHPILALKILRPSIVENENILTSLTDSEKIIYASVLPMIGLYGESLEILSTVNSEEYPESLLSSSFAHFGMWNYRKSIPLLKKYIQSDSISEYKKIVGKVNLVAAYINTFEFDKARKWIEIVQKEIAAKDYLLLYGNTLELQAQIDIHEKYYVNAEKTLEKAAVILKTTDGIYMDLVRKWQWICLIMKGNLTAYDFEQFNKFRMSVKRKKYWEISRDCDLFMGLALKDEEIIMKSVIGTPYSTFRHRAERILERKLPIPSNYTRAFSDKDLIYSVRDKGLLFQPTLFRLLNALNEDFYKPVSLGSLFKSLFENEYFNPYSSPKRVFNCIYRLRKWFKENNWELEIDSDRMNYSLSGEGKIEIYKIAQQKEAILLQKFHDKYDHATFRARDLVSTLDLSKRYANNIIKIGIENKKLDKSGKGPNTIYKWVGGSGKS